MTVRPSTPCSNNNHGRANVAVRYCPNCGMAVNERIPEKRCCENEHAERRRKQHTYCVDCGARIREDR